MLQQLMQDKYTLIRQADMTSIELLWHPREQGPLIMKHLAEEELGHHMDKMAGTLDHH
jgi:hypothetical protein